jgi:hypothetical protein
MSLNHFWQTTTPLQTQASRYHIERHPLLSFAEPPYPWHKRHQRQHTLYHYLARGHCTKACQKSSTGSKAPGPDAISNVILKFLPDSTHDFVFTIFKVTAKHNYTPKKWWISNTNLIYNPNKTNSYSPANFNPISLINCMLKLWTSILTIIET